MDTTSTHETPDTEPGGEGERRRRRFGFIRTRKGKVATAFVTGLLMVGSFAAAQWVGTAVNSNGSAKGASFVNPSVVADTTSATAAPVAEQAYPATTATGTLYITVTNTNRFPVKLTNINAPLVSFPTVGSCTGSFWDIIGGANPTTVPVVIPNGTTNVKVSNVVQLKDTADTSCQGVVVTPTNINYTFGT